MAHRYSKAPLELTPIDYKGSQLSWGEELQAEVQSWSALWREGEDPPQQSFGDIPILPDLTVDQIRSASSSFRTATCALGGIHPRHIRLLSDDALCALIVILHRAEAVGTMPTQLFATFVTLLPKSSGGLRPTAWAQSVFRVWSRARQPLVKQWEGMHTHHYRLLRRQKRPPPMSFGDRRLNQKLHKPMAATLRACFGTCTNAMNLLIITS